jgi:hypothetical protein
LHRRLLPRLRAVAHGRRDEAPSGRRDILPAARRSAFALRLGPRNFIAAWDCDNHCGGKQDARGDEERALHPGLQRFLCVVQECGALAAVLGA